MSQLINTEDNSGCRGLSVNPATPPTQTEDAGYEIRTATFCKRACLGLNTQWPLRDKANCKQSTFTSI